MVGARGRQKVAGVLRTAKRCLWRVAACVVAVLAASCLRARVRGRVALLLQAFADVLTRRGVWWPAECCVARCAKLGMAEHLWPVSWVSCQACVYDGQSVITRIVPHARMREQAKNRLFGGVWCVFVLLLECCVALWAHSTPTSAGGQGVTRACCYGHMCARWPHLLCVAASH